ncbi:hypothetical protein BKA80DRAFT_81616 [Phyllosticta citrichinensis]
MQARFNLRCSVPEPRIHGGHWLDSGKRSTSKSFPGDSSHTSLPTERLQLLVVTLLRVFRRWIQNEPLLHEHRSQRRLPQQKNRRPLTRKTRPPQRHTHLTASAFHNGRPWSELARPEQAGTPNFLSSPPRPVVGDEGQLVPRTRRRVLPTGRVDVSQGRGRDAVGAWGDRGSMRWSGDIC